jgi:uncharacterized membrane protein
MLKSKFPRFLVILATVVTLLCSFGVTGIFAETTPTPTPTPTPIPVELKLTCDIPSYVEETATSFFYNVELSYSGSDTIVVTLDTTPPQGWNSYLTYSSKQVSSIPIGPLAYGSPDTKSLSVNMQPNSGVKPDPGTYKMTVKATSANFTKTLELTAVIKTKYVFSINTANSNLAMKATAGKDNNLAIEMFNTGSAALQNITFTSSKPDGWTIKFQPEKIDSLAAGKNAQANVIIIPPKDKTIAGDYNISLTATNDQVSSYMNIRVTVETPAIWGTVALIVIVVVIVGLAVLFLKLGRR